MIPRWKKPEWREYQNRWRRATYKKRRDEFFSDKVCIDCNCPSFLELDHIDKKSKVSHKIWFMEERKKRERDCKMRSKM